MKVKRQSSWTAILILFVVTGCTTGTEINQNANSNANSSANANASRASNTNAAATATPATTSTPGAAARNVDVTLTEFKIEMPSSVKAGSTSFRVSNKGTVEHNFEVEGQGLEKKFEANLKPGETKTLIVDLKPGTYEVYCPVGNHGARGMTLKLIVE
jgi:uncharacterized cupredoxin-like copper-binding protein